MVELVADEHLGRAGQGVANPGDVHRIEAASV